MLRLQYWVCIYPIKNKNKRSSLGFVFLLWIQSIISATVLTQKKKKVYIYIYISATVNLTLWPILSSVGDTMIDDDKKKKKKN